MIEIKFSGDPVDTANEMREYLRTRGGIAIDAPDDVTRAILYEPVRSDSIANEVYWVTLVNDTMPVACTCKGFHYGMRRERAKDPRKGASTKGFTCKHMSMARARHKRF
jgi:hypothetical protein